AEFGRYVQISRVPGHAATSSVNCPKTILDLWPDCPQTIPAGLSQDNLDRLGLLREGGMLRSRAHQLSARMAQRQRQREQQQRRRELDEESGRADGVRDKLAAVVGRDERSSA